MIFPPRVSGQVIQDLRQLIKSLIAMGCDTPTIDALISVECSRRMETYQNPLKEVLAVPEFTEKAHLLWQRTHLGDVGLVFPRIFDVFMPEYILLVSRPGGQWRDAWERPEHTYHLSVIKHIPRVRRFEYEYYSRHIVDCHGDLIVKPTKFMYIQFPDYYTEFSEGYDGELQRKWHRKRPRQDDEPLRIKVRK